jgi:radical SAM superfamily enzyme YgiQ (UPF0313 family)
MLGIPGETREDAFKTMRMVKYMRRIMPSISFYAPYPGSALGYQLIAEGKSLMTKENYHRFPDDEKVARGRLSVLSRSAGGQVRRRGQSGAYPELEEQRRGYSGPDAQAKA